jgi:hypothetical protein
MEGYDLQYQASAQREKRFLELSLRSGFPTRKPRIVMAGPKSVGVAMESVHVIREVFVRSRRRSKGKHIYSLGV